MTEQTQYKLVIAGGSILIAGAIWGCTVGFGTYYGKVLSSVVGIPATVVGLILIICSFFGKRKD